LVLKAVVKNAPLAPLDRGEVLILFQTPLLSEKHGFPFQLLIDKVKLILKNKKTPSKKRGRFYEVKSGVCCLGLVFKTAVENTP